MSEPYVHTNHHSLLLTQVENEVRKDVVCARTKHGLQHDLPAFDDRAHWHRIGEQTEMEARARLATAPSWAAILGEEWGEAMCATTREELRAELLQVAATAINFVAALDDGIAMEPHAFVKTEAHDEPHTGRLLAEVSWDADTREFKVRSTLTRKGNATEGKTYPAGEWDTEEMAAAAGMMPERYHATARIIDDPFDCTSAGDPPVEVDS